MSVTFETKVWERDWEIILGDGHLEEKIGNCNFPFQTRIVFINNVDDEKQVALRCDALISKGVIDERVIVSQHAKSALEFFEIDPENLGKGYYYSIAELVSIYLSETTHILHFSGDSGPDRNAPDDWMRTGLRILEENSAVKVFNLTWNQNYQQVKAQSIYEDDYCYYGVGFSDQMYLVERDVFRQKIYDHQHPSAKVFPKYGGELFEKRVYSWMIVSDYLRATLKNGSYTHENFHEKPSIVKKLTNWSKNI